MTTNDLYNTILEAIKRGLISLATLHGTTTPSIAIIIRNAVIDNNSIKITADHNEHSS